MPEHPGSRELYDKVATWEDCSIPFSKNFGWTRWGLLGVLSDYVLHYTKGDIVEIGVCETSIFFTKLSKKYHRKVYHCDLQRSVIENCKTVPGYFLDSNIVFQGSSDEFFKQIKLTPIALGFIDGDHIYEQVKKDFNNLFPYIVQNGYIFLHDTYPPNDDWKIPSRCGTVFQLREELEKRDDIEIFTFIKSAWDVGLTMVRKK